MTKVVGVRFRQVGKIYFFAPGKYSVETGQHVIVETARGVEYGQVVLGEREVEDTAVIQPLKAIIRVATPEDDEREIKRKYHKIISRFHPDSLNEVGEAHIQRAQEINEAYRILSQSDSREMQNVYGTEVYGTEAHGTDNHKSGKREQHQEWSGELIHLLCRSLLLLTGFVSPFILI